MRLFSLLYIAAFHTVHVHYFPCVALVASIYGLFVCVFVVVAVFCCFIVVFSTLSSIFFSPLKMPENVEKCSEFA